MKSIIAVFLTMATSAFGASIALTPERPVSAPLFGPAANDQHVRGVASNDQIAFAIWTDRRSGSTELFATRIDASGVILDPAGILIPKAIRAAGVVWSGAAFVIVTDTELIFVAPDGTIVNRASAPVNGMRLIATSGSGPGVRMLFLSGTRGVILDGSGAVVSQSVELWPSGQLASFFVAGGGDSGFLVLYKWVGNNIYASRIDRDGMRLTSAASGIDPSRVGAVPAIAGDADSWLVAGRGAAQMTVFPLNRDGVMTGSPVTLEDMQNTYYDLYSPVVISAKGSYAVAWTTNVLPAPPAYAADTGSSTSVVRIAASGALLAQSAPHRESYIGSGFETAGVNVGSRLIVVSSERHGKGTGVDPIARVLSEALGEVVEPFSISSTAARQTMPRVASSRGNYAVLWTEYGPDASTHLALRRFSFDGLPIDAAPIDVASDVDTISQPSAQIAAARDTYIVAWPLNYTSYGIRRLSASTGAWIDEAPFVISLAYRLRIGSNGDTGLAVYSNGSTWNTRVLNASGPAAEQEIRVTLAASPDAIASNGRDYLIAGTDRCVGCDFQPSWRVLAERLTANGAQVDASPLVLDPGGLSDSVAAAWNGSRWVVLWSESGSLLGAHVSTNGVLTENGTKIAASPIVGEIAAPTLVASGPDLTFIAPQTVYTPTSSHATTLSRSIPNR